MVQETKKNPRCLRHLDAFIVYYDDSLIYRGLRKQIDWVFPFDLQLASVTKFIVNIQLSLIIAN